MVFILNYATERAITQRAMQMMKRIHPQPDPPFVINVFNQGGVLQKSNFKKKFERERYDHKVKSYQEIDEYL